MFDDNKNFYPTPKILIDKMFSKINNRHEIKYILEPSAGDGRIVDHIKDYMMVGIDVISAH